MKHLRSLLLVMAFSAAWAAACGPPAPGPVYTPDNPSAGASDGGCALACVGLQKAGCEEGQPTAAGASCREVCESTAATRHWPLACWAKAETRSQVIACGKTRCLLVVGGER